MNEVITIGVDLAKNVFQVHGVDAEGTVVVQRQLRRARVIPFFKKQPPCLVGMEACATAHHWARQLIELGHRVKLMPPHYVKPYVKRSKNDKADAGAICEAVTRPTMRFVSVKGTEQQSVLVLHRARELLVRQRTMLVNAIRAHMAEFGIVAPTGVPQVKKLLVVIADQADTRLPSVARTCLESLVRQFLSLHQEIHTIELRINAWHRVNEASRRLETIPGIGPIIASALAASISDPEVFKNGRELAAWIGLVPRQNSTGGKQRLGKISKQGDQYLRWLLVAGAMSVVLHANRRGTTNMPWLANIIDRKPNKVVAVALANRNARIVWALLMHGGTYQKPTPVAAA
jgi:transposase